MSQSFVAAVIQQAIDGNDKEQNLRETAVHVREAVEEGAELVVLQELHTTRYFCQTEDPENFELAEALDGFSSAFCSELAAELDIVLVISIFEKRAPGLYHNTALVIDGVDGVVGVYRKMHIPDDPGYYEKFYFTPGDASEAEKGFLPVDTRLGRLGVLVCWDQWYPEAARLMAMAGAEVLIYPTAIGWDPDDDEDEQDRQLDAWLTIQRAHAIANGIPVLVANRTGFEPSPEDEEVGAEFWGTSFIAGPQGELLVSANVEEEGVFLANIDLTRSEQVRRMWPYFRDRRIDAYDNLTKRWIDNTLV